MRLDYAVLCDSCAAENGKHYINGGGWDAIRTDSLPMEYPQLCVAVRLLLDGSDRRRAWTVELDVLDPDDATVVPAPVRGTLAARSDDQLPTDRFSAECIAFRAVYVRLEQPGPHAAVIRIDGAEVRRLPFWVVLLELAGAQSSASSPRTAATREGNERWLWTGPASDGDAWLWRGQTSRDEAERG
ncbi:MAG: hypothetical protein JOY80_06600 [Candidatus Dormibacteraeota bacterium]|nr:hypothetical protein [Candidatus Dormibacteraeota bacterium]